MRFLKESWIYRMFHPRGNGEIIRGNLQYSHKNRNEKTVRT
ncbi:hypothetical protein LEP1GSC050_1056 [Leptospira broomii serovar Hurstbridge str. 5399]|uniref:Uncharacterized protein n=1 Tax=Leptospira broomii serovar Hurstbridge str. 5399 TaxID=1049789 RepID=T0FGK1_9LEPT|nr:hypothetical protein LEP1GSC050_1056 [Leptospira broomii serovar Hurstbridge str. 5399]